MLTKRIIPCLDVKDGRTVKGTNFVGLRDAGDPVELARRYSDEGADELVFLDITATNEKRRTFAELVKRVASEINIPFTVGGGINSVQDIELLLNAGADKVSINTAAVKDPPLIEQAARNFGSQCIVLAIDARCEDSGFRSPHEVRASPSEDDPVRWLVYLNGGRVATEINAIEWAKKGTDLGAGEILLTSMNADGTKAGFEIELTRQISETVGVPVIASGGAGTCEHFLGVFTTGKADAALAASIFHFREIEIPQLKVFLKDHNIPVRI